MIHGRAGSVLTSLPLTSSCLSHSCCGWWRCLRSGGEPGRVELAEQWMDGATRGKRDSRAVTVMMRMSALECQGWGRHRGANGYASFQVRHVYSNWISKFTLNTGCVVLFEVWHPHRYLRKTFKVPYYAHFQVNILKNCCFLILSVAAAPLFTLGLNAQF